MELSLLCTMMQDGGLQKRFEIRRFGTAKYPPRMISVENSEGKKTRKPNMLQYASRKVISPYGEDTHALRLTSELVDLRAGHAKRS